MNLLGICAQLGMGKYGTDGWWIGTGFAARRTETTRVQRAPFGEHPQAPALAAAATKRFLWASVSFAMRSMACRNSTLSVLTISQ